MYKIMAPRKKTTAKSKGKGKTTKTNLQAQKQMWAVVLFALGILLGALTLVEGDRLWKGIHDRLFGLFGWSAYFLSPLMIYIAVVAAMDKPLSSIKAKLWQMGVLIFMISGAIQIFSGRLPETGNVIENILALYDSGIELDSGGVAGALFALPLIGLFGTGGASIIILLAIFVFVMLITGSTLISLYHYLTRPVKGLESAYAAHMEDRMTSQAAQQREEKAKPPAKPRFDIDVDISADNEPPMPAHPVRSPKPSQDIPAAEEKESPVEYISAAEFARPGPEEPESLPQPEPVPLHPLEEEIVKAQETAGDDDIAGIIDRCVSEAPPVADDLTMEEKGEGGNPQTIPLYELPPPAAVPAQYRKPPVTLLKTTRTVSGEVIGDELKNNAQTLVDTLKSFGVQTRITDICRGPAVTRYELQPSAGVKISKITGLADDIALNLASAGIRIEAPIPNKAAVGIEVPNKNVSMVSIRELVESPDFQNADSKLTVALGKDIAGNIILADIGKMPHVLIAGATGSGKSVCINSIIISLLYRATPDEVKLLMIDPKVVELGVYNAVPHLLVPVVTDPKKAAGALGWAVTEMLNRYKAFAERGVRDLTGYNRLAEDQDELAPMPRIVIIIDELADLMMAAPGDVEDSICRLAQMARAAGMHLVIATQRPSVDVITGVIKANIPSRIAFAVSSMVDSRTILDMGGAEKLLGRGDMLFYPVGSSKPQRVQGCFVTDAEVESVVGYIKEGETMVYDEQIVAEIDRHAVAEKSGKGGGAGNGGDDTDDMLPQAIECVVEAGQASTSQLQRRLKLGYARAARIIDQLEEKGVVGPFEGSKPRQVLISKERWMEMKLSGAEDALLENSGVSEEAPF